MVHNFRSCIFSQMLGISLPKIQSSNSTKTGFSPEYERISVSFRKDIGSGRLFLAHSKNELMQWRGVRRLSVRL